MEFYGKKISEFNEKEKAIFEIDLLLFSISYIDAHKEKFPELAKQVEKVLNGKSNLEAFKELMFRRIPIVAELLGISMIEFLIRPKECYSQIELSKYSSKDTVLHISANISEMDNILSVSLFDYHEN